MSYYYAGSFYETRGQAIRAAVADFISPSIEDAMYLDDEEIMCDLFDNGWALPYGANESDVLDALKLIREAYADNN